MIDDVVIRLEKTETRSINTYLPVRGRAVLVDQGKNLTSRTIAIASDKIIDGDCEAITMYGEEYSGGVMASKSILATAGTPFHTTTFVCLKEPE